MLRWTVTVLAITCLTACEVGDLRDEPLAGPGGGGGFAGEVGGPKWTWPDDPNDFGSQLEATLQTELDRLSLTGAAKKSPWPASVWPALHDGANYRWLEGELSPMEKFDAAISNWPVTKNFEGLAPFNPARCAEADFDAEYYEALGPAALWTSRHRGNWAAHDREDSDGDGTADECDDYDGVETTRDLDHAWTAAAMVEAEPSQPVEYGGVTFWPSDLKALLLTVYDDAQAFVLTGACRGAQLERDSHGAVSEKSCAGMDAGEFHLIVTNVIGEFRAVLGEDTLEGGRMVSRPLDSYVVELQRDIDRDTVFGLLGMEPSPDGSYDLNPDARSFVEVQLTTHALEASEPSQSGLLDQVGTFKVARGYHYILELDGDRRIIGGQWIADESSGQVPDFLWIAQGVRPPRITSPADSSQDGPSNPLVTYDSVLEILAATPNGDEDDLLTVNTSPE